MFEKHQLRPVKHKSHTKSINAYITVKLNLCLCCVQVSIIDDGLLRFSKLEELVLSANRIQEIPAENLPSCLKVSPVPACSAALRI